MYLNHVTAFDYFKENNKDNIVVALKRSSQKIKNIQSTSPEFDFSIIAQDEILILSRDVNAAKPQGALYAHSCPNCGASIKDTVEINCTYCAAPLNSTKFEWIISNWMSANEYDAFKQANTASFVIDKNIGTLDDLFESRDYALNNVIMMIAADGRITHQEMKFVEKIAKKWNYDLSKIQGFLQLAQNNKLVVRLPQDAKQKQKIIALMEKAAHLDEEITSEEKQLLQQVKMM